jgi:hypothetical protein
MVRIDGKRSLEESGSAERSGHNPPYSPAMQILSGWRRHAFAMLVERVGRRECRVDRIYSPLKPRRGSSLGTLLCRQRMGGGPDPPLAVDLAAPVRCQYLAKERRRYRHRRSHRGGSNCAPGAGVISTRLTCGADRTTSILPTSDSRQKRLFCPRRRSFGSACFVAGITASELLGDDLEQLPVRSIAAQLPDHHSVQSFLIGIF